MESLKKQMTKGAPLDAREVESDYYLESLAQRSEIHSQKISGVGTVLVVLSSRGMVYDPEAIRQKILSVYPDAAVFFRNTDGKALGVSAPQKVDLLIDLTGQGQRQPWFYSRKLRKMARFAVGRDAGFFRKRIYDRVLEEAPFRSKIRDILDYEQAVQREVFALAGIPMSRTGDLTEDLEKVIALDLPLMKKG